MGHYRVETRIGDNGVLGRLRWARGGVGVKFLLELVQILEFLDVKNLFMPDTNVVYNDNCACIQWAKKATSKGLRHIQMRENRARENVTSKFIDIRHVDGKHNIADIFTKEMRDTTHFVELRDLFMCSRFST